MKLFPLLVLLLAFTACAPAPTGAYDVNTQALFLAQTRDAAGDSANVFAALAMETAIAQTATRQATLDAQNDTLTHTANELAIANATASATRVYATEQTQRDHATGTATIEQGLAMQRVAATALARQNEYAATAQAHDRATATWEAASPTRAYVAALAAATTQAQADARTIAAAEAKARADTAWLWEVGRAAGLLVFVLALFGFAFLGAFFLMRWWMVHEQNMRIVEKGERVIVIESGNHWGGNPTYKVIEAPRVLELPAGEPLTAEPVPDAARSLPHKHLNLAEQPHGLSLPCGATANGDKWIPLARAGHILIGGPSGSGKTYLVHAFVQALLHRGMADLVLHDGKRGLEFARYATEPRVRVVEPGELERALADALGDMAQRYEKMLERGVRDIERYNVAVDEPMRRTVIVLDELKEIDEQARGQVLSLMRMGRAAGIHLILATQFPDARTVPTDIRGNATTRIAFAVANHHESAAILGSAGAESLPRVPGRALLECFGERVEVQTFTVDLPDAPVVTVAPSPFSDVEKKMIQLALDEGGWFKVKKTARELKMSDAAVTATAEAWERRGWLSPEQSNVGRPGKNGRALLPPLADLAKKHGIAMSPKAHHVAHVPHVLMSPKAPPA